MSRLVQELMTHTAERLEGSGLTFALIFWKPGAAEDIKSVAFATPTESEREASTAAKTAAEEFARRLSSVS